MQQAIPYSSGRAWPPLPTHSIVIDGRTSLDGVRQLVAEKPVVVVGRRGCCMCHVVKRLLFGLGVNPTVCEVGEETDETALMKVLAVANDASTEADRQQQQQQHSEILFPAVFIGGRLVGGLDRLMAVHISGDLVPTLKEAGALWL